MQEVAKKLLPRMKIYTFSLPCEVCWEEKYNAYEGHQTRCSCNSCLYVSCKLATEKQNGLNLKKRITKVKVKRCLCCTGYDLNFFRDFLERIPNAPNNICNEDPRQSKLKRFLRIPFLGNMCKMLDINFLQNVFDENFK